LREDGELGILGYSILPEFWNMGFATEACKRIVNFGFEYLELSTMQASTTENNIASMKVLEKIGFSLREGEIKENSIHSGERLVRKYQIQSQ
jgi:RimJ/RimL family protein N-acetyltransferase